jgi:cell division protease FtsH
MTQIEAKLEGQPRPWWRSSKVWWFIGIAVGLVLLIGIVIAEASKPPPLPYGAFLDQLEAGNVANITFQGTEIDGRFKRPLDATLPTGTAERDRFRSRVPDVGDPALIPELRKQRVMIDVGSPSQWTSLLGGLPWPMLLFVGAALIAGLIRLMRGGKAGSGSAVSMHPMQGMIGLISGLFKKQQSPGPPKHDGDDAKSR